MYNPDANKHKPNPMNPRDFMDGLDVLIKMRCTQVTMPTAVAAKLEEAIELTKRELTDYLLDIDKRPGIYVKGDNQ